ncbi:MAG TPA: sugar ABC transporter substrate-binding protein [Opitutaceae bacterium]|nr:sugar ABC transporter substrate-binding protein [Opitutaceae bacterium]
MKALTLLLCLLGLALVSSCRKSDSSAATVGAPGEKNLTVGVSFETLQTEYWVAGLDAIRAELKARHYSMLEAVADGDANRQLEQVKNFITRKVDGIILVPKDAQTCLPMIKAANAAGIPIALFNRPAEPSSAKSVAVVADNFALTRETASYLIGLAKKSGEQHEAMILLGDLGDINAVGRRDGFEAAVKGNESIIKVVAQVPTEWSQEKAQAGVVNALQSHPNIRFIFTSSDFLLPSIVSALKSAGRYKPAGDPDHVLLGGFDGDATAYGLLKDGYLDATGVQDVYFEAKQAVQAIVDLRAGKDVPPLIQDPGFVIHRDNLTARSSQMWGAQVSKR